MNEDDIIKEYNEKIKAVLNNKNSLNRYNMFLQRNKNALFLMFAADEKKLLDAIAYIENKKSAFAGKDIGKMSIDELINMVDAHKVKSAVNCGKVEKILCNEEYLIFSPLDYNASVKYGRNTKWCISAKTTREHWDRYTEDFGKFYFVINSGIPVDNPLHKIAVLVDTCGAFTIWDSLSRIAHNIDLSAIKQYLKPYIPTRKEIMTRYRLIESEEYPGRYDSQGDLDINLSVTPLVDENNIPNFKFGIIHGYFSYNGQNILKDNCDWIPKCVNGDCSFTIDHDACIVDLSDMGHDRIYEVLDKNLPIHIERNLYIDIKYDDKYNFYNIISKMIENGRIKINGSLVNYENT